MIWRVLWSPKSMEDLLDVGFETAAVLGHAVIRWTETGEGWMEPAGEGRYRVLARGSFVLVAVDEAKNQIAVLRVVADNPLPFVAPLLDEPDDNDDDD